MFSQIVPSGEVQESVHARLKAACATLTESTRHSELTGMCHCSRSTTCGPLKIFTTLLCAREQVLAALTLGINCVREQFWQTVNGYIIVCGELIDGFEGGRLLLLSSERPH